MNEDKEDDIYIGCMTVQMGLWNPGNVAKGCVVKQCGTCGVDVNLAPTSQKLLAAKPDLVHLICMPCLQKRARETPKEEMKFMGAVPGAVEEALENIARAKKEKEDS